MQGARISFLQGVTGCPFSDTMQLIIYFILGSGGPSDDGDSLGANNSSDEEWSWNSPLASNSIVKSGDANKSLQEFIAQAVKPFGMELEIQVSRNTDLLKQVIRKYKHPAFDITKPLCVEFVNELALDGGGVSREFFHLLMERLKSLEGDLRLFEGHDGHLVPIHDYDVMSGGLFVLVRKMILHSILNDCNGVSGLSPAVAAYVVTGCQDAAVECITINDLPDPVLKDNLQQVQDPAHSFLY